MSNIKYSEGLKQSILSKLLSPGAPSIRATAKETGIPLATILHWVSNAKSKTEGARSMSGTDLPRSPQNWLASEKLQAVIDTFDMSVDEICAYCRQKGIYVHNLNDWKSTMMDSLNHKESRAIRSANKNLRHELKRLNKELTIKEKALAETASLLVLKKKAHLIWGENEAEA